jgi:hypothetical protein
VVVTEIVQQAGANRGKSDHRYPEAVRKRAPS